MQFTIKSKGKIIDFSKFSKKLQTELQKSLWRTGKQIKKTVQKDSLAKKSGVKYKHLKRRSSSENETSARQSGDKVKATTFNVARNRLDIGVNSKIKYAEAIEYGTMYMKARKDIEVATKKNLNYARDDLQKTLERTTNNTIKIF